MRRPAHRRSRAASRSAISASTTGRRPMACAAGRRTATPHAPRRTWSSAGRVGCRRSPATASTRHRSSPARSCGSRRAPSIAWSTTAATSRSSCSCRTPVCPRRGTWCSRSPTRCWPTRGVTPRPPACPTTAAHDGRRRQRGTWPPGPRRRGVLDLARPVPHRTEFRVTALARFHARAAAARATSDLGVARGVGERAQGRSRRD